MKVQTEVLDLSADAQLINLIVQKVSKLKKFFNRLNDARMILKLYDSNNKKSSVAEVKIYLPQGIIYIRENCKTLEGALIKTFVSLKLQLLRHSPK